MDLTLTPDQEALVDAFSGFLTKLSPASVVRAAEPLGHDAELWAKAVEMGVPMMATPDAAGGGGASMLDLALVAELAGRHLAPVPYVETVVATRLLAAAGAGAWLERAHAGAIVTLAVRPPVGGTSRLVPAGAVADAIVALDGDELVIASAGKGPSAGNPVAGSPAAGNPVAGNIASAPLADRRLDGARQVLATGERARRLYSAALDEWRVLASAVLSGMSSAALEIGVAYTKQREQFGRPIAAFQSIAHRLADDATDVGGLQLLSRKAAWAVDDDPPAAHRLASMAYLWGGEVANRVTGNSLHFHGGYGFMLEYDIQLYYRRAKLWSVLLGDPRSGFSQLGRDLFASTGAEGAR